MNGNIRHTSDDSGSGPSSEFLRELKEDFSYCDENNDGRLQYAEFVRLLENLDAGMSAEEYRIGFQEVDTNRDGYIDFEEFVSWWTAK